MIIEMRRDLRNANIEEERLVSWGGDSMGSVVALSSNALETSDPTV